MLTASSLGALAVALIIALTPVCHFAEFVALPAPILGAIAIIAVTYLAAAEAAKPFAMYWAPKGLHFSGLAGNRRRIRDTQEFR
jgi:P-type Mg2+ transporter